MAKKPRPPTPTETWVKHWQKYIQAKQKGKPCPSAVRGMLRFQAATREPVPWWLADAAVLCGLRAELERARRIISRPYPLGDST